MCFALGEPRVAQRSVTASPTFRHGTAADDGGRMTAWLAVSINSEHRLAHLRLGEALSHAVEAGELLLRARENDRHGG
jgi:hypothetical protein